MSKLIVAFRNFENAPKKYTVTWQYVYFDLLCFKGSHSILIPFDVFTAGVVFQGFYTVQYNESERRFRRNSIPHSSV
jgi:hypothetical protein